MTEESKGILGAGAALVWRHQRVLWWVFAVNFVLGGMGASSAARTLSDALSHSLAGKKLSNGFDVGMFMELVVRPEVRLFRSVGTSIVFVALFLLFLLFVTGGILLVYRDERRLSTGEFFEACGRYFWPLVRLLLWSLIPFAVVNFLYEGVSWFSTYIGDRAVADRTGFCILLAGCIPVVLLFAWVRMWFDLAQVRAVALDNRVMRRNAMKAFSLAKESSAPLFWVYLLIGSLAWVVTVILLLLWAKLPPKALPVTLLLLELIMVAHIGTRLWQKACATVWYARNPEPVPVAVEPYSPPVQASGEMANQPAPADVDAPLTPYIEPPEPEQGPPSEPEK